MRKHIIRSCWLAIVSISFLSYAHPSFADELAIGLDLDTLQWPEEEFICGGHLDLTGGIVRSVKNVDIYTDFKNDSSQDKSEIDLHMEQLNLTYLRAAEILHMEQATATDWFIVDGEKGSSATCPGADCLVRISGSLNFCVETDNGFTDKRKVSLNTANFFILPTSVLRSGKQ